MDATAWRSLFESFRPEDQKSLLIRTSDGFEVAVEMIARIEQDVVLIKGRLAGSAEGRRIFIIPFDKLSTILVNRVVTNDEIPLFSPSVSIEEKKRIAHEVAEAQRRSQEETLGSYGDQSGDAKTAGDTKAQLDEIKRLAEQQAAPKVRTGTEKQGLPTRPVLPPSFSRSSSPRLTNPDS